MKMPVPTCPPLWSFPCPGLLQRCRGPTTIPEIYREGPLPHLARSFPNWPTAAPHSALASGTQVDQHAISPRSSNTLSQGSPEEAPTPASPFRPPAALM